MHGVGADMLDEAQNDATGQTVALALPGGQYVPFAHTNCVADVELLGQNEPAAHTPDTSDSPVVAQNAPPTHGIGLDRPSLGHR